MLRSDADKRAAKLLELGYNSVKLVSVLTDDQLVEAGFMPGDLIVLAEFRRAQKPDDDTPGEPSTVSEFDPVPGLRLSLNSDVSQDELNRQGSVEHPRGGADTARPICTSTGAM